MRSSFGRHLAREFREQRRMRTRGEAELWQRSFEETIAFANRMRHQSPGYRAWLTRNGMTSPERSGQRRELVLLEDLPQP